MGAGIEDADGKPLSQILLAANRTAIIDPSDGNTVPMLVAQGGQIFLNEVLTKSLSINGRFIVTFDGIMTATGAHVMGKIDADSGTLNNVTVNENYTILGTVDAGNVPGDVYFRSLFYLDKVVYNAIHPARWRRDTA
ncbi:phage tail tip fiber protein [Salmonella enterica subsp. enterica serovar Glostrup]